jgi:hypothetical protein
MPQRGIHTETPNKRPHSGEILAQSEKIVLERPTIGRDLVIIFIVAGGLVGLYALFKAVSILAGLPFP